MPCAAAAQPFRMVDPVDYEEGVATEPLAAEDESSIKAEAMIAKLAYSIAQAHAVDAIDSVGQIPRHLDSSSSH